MWNWILDISIISFTDWCTFQTQVKATLSWLCEVLHQQCTFYLHQPWCLEYFAWWNISIILSLAFWENNLPCVQMVVYTIHVVPKLFSKVLRIQYSLSASSRSTCMISIIHSAHDPKCPSRNAKNWQN